MHVIVTLRSKQAYAIVNGDNGKTEVKKLGLEPVFREGFEFECSIFIELNIDGNLAIVTKDRSSLFRSQTPFQITEATGKKILDWLESGVNPNDES